MHLAKVDVNVLGMPILHSGEASGAFMLGAWTTRANGSVVATEITALNIRETVCGRCHVEGSRTHTTTPVP